ncbi:hypothetical protein ACHAXA_003936 [Cyclostephanos tholiformis]|uniref:Uncharacterized protein n=1 Tax=Cyclostephanos tholiformis TaxID=382380 RepID=A0ABD3R2D6_9STRA
MEILWGALRGHAGMLERRYQPRSESSNSSFANNKRRHDINRSITPYPKSMREYDRFFGSMLSSSTAAMQMSETDGSSHRAVIQRACSLLNVPCLPTSSYLQQKKTYSESIDAGTHHLMQRTSSLLSNVSHESIYSSSGSYDNARHYYMSMAPLVLEESRCIIAESLTNISRIKRDGCTFSLELLSIEEKYQNPAGTHMQNAPLLLNFQIDATDCMSRKQRCNSDISAKWMRPGCVLLLRRQSKHSSDLKTSVLACIVPNGNRLSESSSFLSLMIFRRDHLDIGQSDAPNNSDDKALFYATALTTLISQVRQMEACLRMYKVSFMRKLLGQKKSTHIRFNSSDDDDVDELVFDGDDDVGGDALQEALHIENEDTISSEEVDVAGADFCALLTKIPKLNETQEIAARMFLNSPKESLILVQGPPGTGKTTFLVHVLCRRLAINPHARIMVSAPTNKAVTVLAERFLDIINSADNDLSCKCNAVLIGVEDKLISQYSENDANCLTTEAMTSPLQSIFVYSWAESLKNECRTFLLRLTNLFTEQKTTNNKIDTSLDTLITLAEKIKTKLSMSIPSQRSVCAHARSMVQQLRAAAAAVLWESSIHDFQCGVYGSYLEKAIYQAKHLIDALDDMDSPVQELLATARVIFCTLSTSGASIFKQTCGIDDLIIDEAAAATEPEICIPFHLRPQRMLAVGDPLQLPPTIMSRHAVGLSRSMHERLMYQCSEDYIILDRQYRMHAQISHFPCHQFYDGRIANDGVISIGDMAFPSMGPYTFINVTGEEFQSRGGSYSNEAECIAICRLIQKIKKFPGWDSPNKLRIITFYHGQVTLLQRLLAQRGFGNVLVATVDSSQGCEADSVIVSFVRSSSTKKGVRAAAGFLSDDRRINVALTRARHQLVCVGNANGTLSQQGSNTLKNLVSDAKRRGALS